MNWTTLMACSLMYSTVDSKCFCQLWKRFIIIIIIINLLSWWIFPTSGVWPVLSPLSSSNPPYPWHPVALLPSFSCLPLPRQFIISLACLAFSILLFLTQTLSLSHLTISSYNMSKPPQPFCFKCSSRSSPPTLDAITVLSTISFNVTPQIILRIRFSVAHSL